MTERLFLGFVPDEAARARLARIAEELGPRLGDERRRVRPSRYHVTLHFLGAYPALPPDRIAAALVALARIDAVPFDLTLDEAISFPHAHRRPCVLRPSAVSEALQTCWRTAEEACRHAGFGDWLARVYTPHLTVFYADVGLDVPMPMEPVRLVVRELCLMHSVPGEAAYRVVSRRALVARP